PEAHGDDGDEHAEKGVAPEPPRQFLQGTFGFQDQPPGAEQRIPEHERNAGEQREWGEAVERMTAEMPPVDFETLDEGAEHDALREGAERRTVAEAVV